MRIRKIGAISVVFIIIALCFLWYFNYFDNTKEVFDGTLVKANQFINQFHM